MFAGNVDLAEAASKAWEARMQEALLVLVAQAVILAVLQ